jgi:hypothetical protein
MTNFRRQGNGNYLYKISPINNSVRSTRSTVATLLRLLSTTTRSIVHEPTKNFIMVRPIL